MSIADSWDRLLATRWLLSGRVGYVAGRTDDDPVFSPAYEQGFASLLLIDLAAILDEALTEIEAQNHFTSNGNQLKHRIDGASAAGLIQDPVALHALRGLRNDIAHDRTRLVGFAELDPHMPHVHRALTELGYAVRPAINYVLEVSRPVDWTRQSEPSDSWERETVIGVRTPGLPIEYLARYRYHEFVQGPDPHDKSAGRVYSFGRWEWS